MIVRTTLDECKRIAQKEIEMLKKAEKEELEKKMDESKIAELTGTAIQDDETFKSEGGFDPERDQFYFELKQGEQTFFLGFKDMLLCLRLLEKMKEIPEIGEKWWDRMATLYGFDILMIE